jgi:hypothetical protein
MEDYAMDEDEATKAAIRHRKYLIYEMIPE